MEAKVRELIRIKERFAGKWAVDDKIRKLAETNEEAGRLLWLARKEGGTTMADSNYLLWLYPGAPDLWDADDFCELIEELQEFHPDGEYTSGSASSWVGALPGAASGLHDMIKEKEGDDAFGKEMRARWKDLPPYWGRAVAYYLAAYGMMPASELPQDLKEEAARLFVRKGSIDHSRTTRGGIPPEEWSQLLAAEAASTDDFTFGDEIILRGDKNPLLELIPHASFEQIVAALYHCPSSIRINSLEALDTVGTLKEIEDALVAVAHTTGGKRNPSQPRRALMLMYLRRCQHEGVVPNPRVDEAIEQFFHVRRHSANDYHKTLCKALGAIPVERLEPMLVSYKKLHWCFIHLCNTPGMAKRIVEELVSFKEESDPPYNIVGSPSLYKEPGVKRDGILYPLREHLAPYALKALQDNPNLPARKGLYQALWLNPQPEAAKCLVGGFADSSEEVRKIAAEAALRIEADALLPHLEPMLNARSKDARQITAGLMRELPAHAKLYAMAQARMAKERVAAIKNTLAAVRRPKELQSPEEARITTLIESEGADWAQYKKTPKALLEAFHWALADAFRNSYAKFKAPITQHWLEALKHLSKKKETLPAALRLLPAFHYGGGDLLSFLKEHFPKLPRALTEMLSGSWPKMPGEFGRSGRDYGWTADDTAGWLAEQPMEWSAPIILHGYTHKSAHETIHDAFVEWGEGTRKTLEKGLKDERLPVRQGAVKALDALRPSESLRALKVALKKETNAKLKTSLSKLVAAIQAAMLVVEAFEESADGDKALNKALGNLQAPDVALPSPLPRVKWKSGVTVGSKAVTWFCSTLCLEHHERREPKLPLIRERMDDASCTALMNALHKGATDDLRFAGNHAFVSAMLGDDALLTEMGVRLYWLVDHASARWGRDAMAALAHRGSAHAIRTLELASRRCRSNTIRRRSGDQLEVLASWRNISLSELLDNAVSDFGFDHQGEKRIDYGGRPFTLKLDADKGVLIIDGESGKVRKSFPKPRKIDDADAANAFKKEFSAMKKTLAQLRTSQKRRLEDALIAQRTWYVGPWKRRFVEHPVMRVLSRGLVWESLDDKGASNGAFMVTKDSTLVDLELETFSLQNTAQVRMLHPLSTDDESIRAWEDLLLEQDILSPYNQLSRRTFSGEEIPETDDELFTDLPSPLTGPFMGTSKRLGYQQGPREDGGAIFKTIKKFGDYTFCIHHSGYIPSLFNEDFEFYHLKAHIHGEEHSWRELPPIQQSEYMLELYKLTRS